MTRYVALLRAVNVGGTGTLPMSELSSMCREAGFSGVETYIASGNVLLDSTASAAAVKDTLETRLRTYAGKSIGVIVRTASEIAAVLKANPFPDAEPRLTYTIFLDAAPPRDALANAVGRGNEQVWLGKREIYVHYPSGMGRSKLRIPVAKAGTARNMGTLARLATMAARR